ncbi:hypothetical protein [Sphingobium yanoikuyae]|uniref:hypothetical protein n=1 Tax=Sphingobium yanoikuyae TaxID=13690 RepID=UPI0012D2C333|nr:hypothetical protein [Sphingobium yanoikuyae]
MLEKSLHNHTCRLLPLLGLIFLSSCAQSGLPCANEVRLRALTEDELERMIVGSIQFSATRPDKQGPLDGQIFTDDYIYQSNFGEFRVKEKYSISKNNIIIHFQKNEEVITYAKDENGNIFSASNGGIYPLKFTKVRLKKISDQKL